MILAIINRMEGTVDMLTGEQLELDAGQLSVSSETVDKKKKNDMLMTALCKEACKIILLIHCTDIYTKVYNNLVCYLAIVYIFVETFLLHFMTGLAGF